MLQNDRQLANTREKLRLLEESYEEVRRETDAEPQVRDAELESLRRFINQLQEEISLYEARRMRTERGEIVAQTSSYGKRRLLSDTELANTRRKLSELERLYASREDDSLGDEELRQASRESLKRMINQLKEEILWTQAHQPAQR